MVIKNVLIDSIHNLLIVKPSVEDAAAVVDFLNDVAGETDYLTFGLGDFPLTTAQETLTILDCLEKNTCLMLLAKLHGEIVSQLFLDVPSSIRLNHIGSIGISVRKKYWGMSIGTQMILLAIDWAKEKKITKLQLQVRTDHVNAIHLYKKLGFQIEGKITRAVRIDGHYFDNYEMGCEL